MSRKVTAGITQLELMISLAILGMITILLASALNNNRQTLERFSSLSQATENMVSLRSLKGWVEQMPVNSSSNEIDALLTGDQASMAFQTLTTGGVFWGGSLAEFQIELQTQDGNQTLLIRGTGRHPVHETQVTSDFIIAHHVERVKFSYFGRKADDTEKGWFSSWSTSRATPELVKIEWETVGGIPYPPLTLQPGKANLQRYMSLSSLLPPE